MQTNEAKEAEAIYQLTGGYILPQIEKWEIESRAIIFDDVRESPPEIKQRATALMVDSIIAYFNRLQASEKKSVLFLVRRKDGTLNTSSGIRMENVDGKRYAFNREDLEEAAIQKKEEYERLYKPREGYTACQYCKKQVPNDKLVKRRIIGRGLKRVYNSWKGRFENKAVVTQEDMHFCSGECALNEQMSREG